MPKTEYDVRMALARAVADRKVDRGAIDDVAARLEKFDYRIRGLNPCIYGICLDFFVEKPELDSILTKAMELGRVRGIRAFPWGIPWPDLFHVVVEQQFDEIPEPPGQFADIQH